MKTEYDIHTQIEDDELPINRKENKKAFNDQKCIISLFMAYLSVVLTICIGYAMKDCGIFDQ